jgi:hypothetical protein
MVSECHDEHVCIEAVRCLYQLCHAFKKLRGPYKPSTLQQQLWSFVEDDIELRYFDFFSEPTYPILQRAREIVRKIFEDMDPEFDVEKFIPRPGPGATNTPRQKHVRYRPHVLYNQIDEVLPYVDYYYSHPWDLVTGSMRYKALERKDAPSSRFKFVPKNYGKPRGICIEEQETQFFQQAIKTAMYDRLLTHPITKGYVNFDDQTVNGRLALTSSKDRLYATLDMSAASDRVSRTLVRYLFHDCPELRESLLAVSTREIELLDDGIDFLEKLPCEKFAPMGSAVCFPVMALVHFVLIKAILSLCELPHDLTRDVYVYGDDIIVRSECVDAVYAYLPLFGMKFNTEKSYVYSHFRESCGVHAFKGVDITPAYVKHVPELHSPRDVVLSLIANEAQLFKAGFLRTAEYLRSAIQKVKSLKGFHIPFVTPKSPVLGFIRDEGDASYRYLRFQGNRRRWNAELQCYDFRVIAAIPSQERLTLESDNEALLRVYCDWGLNLDHRVAFDLHRQATSRIVEGACCALPRIADAIYDCSEPLSPAQMVKDSSAEPPRFRWMWLPDSAL